MQIQKKTLIAMLVGLGVLSASALAPRAYADKNNHPRSVVTINQSSQLTHRHSNRLSLSLLRRKADHHTSHRDGLGSQNRLTIIKFHHHHLDYAHFLDHTHKNRQRNHDVDHFAIHKSLHHHDHYDHHDSNDDSHKRKSPKQKTDHQNRSWNDKDKAQKRHDNHQKPANKLDPSNKRHHLNHHNVDHHGKTNDHQFHRVIHYDYDPAQIDDVDHFARQRARYYYPQVSFNTRDLGGYLTANGRYRVKTDRIIRSAGLENLSNKGIAQLKKLNVRQDVDLRYPQQISDRPDPGELNSDSLDQTNINIQDDPVYSDSEDHQMKTGLRDNGEWYFYGRSAVTNHNAVRAYRRVFRDLLANRHGAILYHCDLGRDRTGVMSALILSALGVKKSVIYHDYLLTDYYHHKSGAHLVPYDQQASELKHFFSTVNRRYGSVHNYLYKVIGLRSQDLKHLKSTYLEPVR